MTTRHALNTLTRCEDSWSPVPDLQLPFSPLWAAEGSEISHLPSSRWGNLQDPHKRNISAQPFQQSRTHTLIKRRLAGRTWFRRRRKAAKRGESGSSVWVQPLGFQLRLLQSHLPLLHLPLQEVIIWLSAKHKTGCEQYTAWKHEHDTTKSTTFPSIQLYEYEGQASHLNTPSHSRLGKEAAACTFFLVYSFRVVIQMSLISSSVAPNRRYQCGRVGRGIWEGPSETECVC